MHADKELLERLDQKLQIIRDRVQSVAGGYSNGMVLWGEGGTSKSFTVLEVLKASGKPFMLSNSRLTAKGLFELLRDYPDVVHVIEDAETLLGDKNAYEVLRSALWGQEGEDGLQERPVDWKIGGKREQVIFTGGVILVANCRMDDNPKARAIKTRIPCLQFQPTNEEVAALMRRIASQGHRHGQDFLSPEECVEVAEDIIARSNRLQRNLDLRLLVNTFNDRLQWANGDSETHWRDMLRSRMQERVVAPAGNYVPRSVQKANELEIARRVANLPRQERFATWKKETGKSESAMYRRLKELGHESSHYSHFSQQRWTDN